MAEPRPPDQVLLVVATFSRHEQALRWARERLERSFGDIGLDSPTYDFVQTAYYEPMMGPGLLKRLFAFRNLVPADGLPAIKLHTNALEQELAGTGAYAEERPLNLDPGFLSLGKFSLATMKDQAHRIYLGAGVFAENTLRFQDGAFEPWTWTYADYRLPEVLAFLKSARDYYRLQLAATKAQSADSEGKKEQSR